MSGGAFLCREPEGNTSSTREVCRIGQAVTLTGQQGRNTDVEKITLVVVVVDKNRKILTELSNAVLKVEELNEFFSRSTISTLTSVHTGNTFATSC